MNTRSHPTSIGRKLRGVNYFCRSTTTISAGEGLAKECRWRPQRHSVIVVGRSRAVSDALVLLSDQENDDGGGRSWKTVRGFPRTGGRVLCVHGSGSVHGLLVDARLGVVRPDT